MTAPALRTTITDMYLASARKLPSKVHILEHATPFPAHVLAMHLRLHIGAAIINMPSARPEIGVCFCAQLATAPAMSIPTLPCAAAPSPLPIHKRVSALLPLSCLHHFLCTLPTPHLLLY